MVELAIGIAAFLFLIWVAIQGFALIGAIIDAVSEDKETRSMVIGLGVCLLLCLLLRWL
jgi:hypothetical protein